MVKYFWCTQRYDLPSIWIGKRFFETLAVKIEEIWNRHWNAERVTVFQTVILKRICLVSITRNICGCITSSLDLWNRGDYGELVQDYYRVSGEILANIHGTQTQDKRHCTLSNLLEITVIGIIYSGGVTSVFECYLYSTRKVDKPG